MNFTTVFPALALAIFLITLLFALAPNRLIGWMLLGLDVVVWLIATKWYSDFLDSPAYDYHSPNFVLLLLIAYLLALLLARPLIKLRAGKLILRLRRSDSTAVLSLLFVPVFLCGAIFTLFPNERREIDGSPVFDAQYFNSHGVLFLSMLVMVLYFLFTGLQRTEFRQRGIIQNGALWSWQRFELYEWHEISDNTSDIDLIFKLRRKSIFEKQLKLAIPYAHRQTIEELLAQVQP
jgi:hypothetical protein